MLEQKILLVSGKGGVGKSMVAASAALRLAQQGKKVLLVELGDKSFYRYIFEAPLSMEPFEWGDNLWVSRWEGEACLRDYIAHLVKVPRLVNLFFDNKAMKALIRAAPALKELSILGKLTSGIRGVGPAMHYDCIVVDAYSTGHFRALLQAPVGMGSAIRFGPMGEQCRDIQSILQDAKKTHVWLVSLPEELPVQETWEQVEFLKQTMKIKSQVVLNKVLPCPLSAEDLRDLKSQIAEEEAAFIRFLIRKEEERQVSAQRLDQSLLGELPYIFKGSSRELIQNLGERIPVPWLNF